MVEEAEHDTPREVVERRKPVATARPRDRRDTEARRHATDFATAAAGARNKLSPGGKKVEQKKVEPCCLKETITPREVVETRKPVATARLRDRRDIEAWRHAAEIATSAAGARNKVSPGGKKVEPCCMEDFFFVSRGVWKIRRNERTSGSLCAAVARDPESLPTTRTRDNERRGPKTGGERIPV